MSLNRILAAFYPIRVGGRKFFIQQAYDWDFLCEADEVYNDFVYENRFFLLNKNQIKTQLIRRGLISHNIDSELVRAQNQISKYQEELYESRDNPVNVKKVRQRLSSLRGGVNTTLTLLSRYYSVCLENKAEYYKKRFLLDNSVYNSDMEFQRDKDIDFIISIVDGLYPGIEDIRKLARTDPWRTLWSIKKGAAFNYSPLTDSQSALAAYSRMYDNVYKHPECPSNMVIEDDDMLDGWFVAQGKKNNKSTKKTTAAHKHGEVFEFVQSKEELEELNNSNTAMAMQRMKLRQAQIRKSGGQPLEHGKLKDVRMENAKR